MLRVFPAGVECLSRPAQGRPARIHSHVEMTVGDTGQGISREFPPFTFDRFRQADDSTSRRHSGPGPGLSIVRHLVEMHGGGASVHSGGPEQGATFTARLPRMFMHDAGLLKWDDAGRRPRPAYRAVAVPRGGGHGRGGLTG
jgi:signal transduction histidine kinase